jgi:hypothetical protein
VLFPLDWVGPVWKKCSVFILQSPCVIISSHSISVANSPSGGNGDRKRHHDSTNRGESSYSGGESSKPEHEVRNSPKVPREEPSSMNDSHEQGETNNIYLKQPNCRPHFEPHFWASMWVPLQAPHCNPLQGNYRVELLHREIPAVITGNEFTEYSFLLFWLHMYLSLC